MLSLLTEREREVLRFLRSALSRREVCARLDLTEEELTEVWSDIGQKLTLVEPNEPEDFETMFAFERIERQRLEGEVWAAEARLNALMDTSTDLIFLIQGRTGRIISANNVVFQTLGYSARELIGNIMEMLVPQDLQTIHVAYRKGFLSSIRKREMGYHPPIKVTCKDGSSIDLDIALTATQATDDVMVLCRVIEPTGAQFGQGVALHRNYGPRMRKA